MKGLGNAATTAWVGRLCLASIFLISGVRKLLAPGATVADIETAGLPVPWVAFAMAAGIELLCGLALVAGYRLQWSAALLAAFTMVAGLVFHQAVADENQLTHLLKNIAITGGLVHVIASTGITQENRR
jgi:putative oxidoreductase